MLFRRVAEHVKQQNWTAVVIDFAIVVVGVFIGLQVANWNEARGDRARELQILQEIRSDLASDVDSYSLSLGTTLRRIITSNYIAQNSNNSALSEWNIDEGMMRLGLSEETLIENTIESDAELKSIWSNGVTDSIKQSLWSSAILVGNAQPGTAAFDSLVSSGNLGIIQNKGLIERLQEYHTMALGVINSQNLTYRGARDAAIAVGHRHGLSGFSKVDEAEFLNLVSNTQELSASLQTVLAFSHVHFKQVAITKPIAEDAIALIDAELAARQRGIE